MDLFETTTYRMWGYPKKYGQSGALFLDLPDVPVDEIQPPSGNSVHLSPFLTRPGSFTSHLNKYQKFSEVIQWWQLVPEEDRQEPVEVDVILVDSVTACRGKPLRRVPKRKDGVVTAEICFVIPVDVATYTGPEDFDEAKIWSRYIAEQVVITVQTILDLPPAPRVGFLQE